MAINWSAIAGGIGEAVNYHVDKRDEEAKRKKAFEDASAMAELNFGYQKQLAEIGATAQVEAARLRITGKGKGNVLNLPDLGQWGAAKEVSLSGTTDDVRFSQKNEAVAAHYASMIAAFENGDFQAEDMEALLESKGGGSFLAQHMQEQYRRFGLPYAKDGYSLPQNNVMFGNLYKIPSGSKLAASFRNGVITEDQAVQQQNYNNQIGPNEVGVPKWGASFYRTQPRGDQNPQAFSLAATPEFRAVKTQLQAGDLESSEDVEGVAKSILGDTANSMSGKQIENAVIEGLVLGGQRNSISNGIIIPNPAHTIIRDSETANSRIGMSKMLLGTIESGVQTILTRKPLVTGPGVAAQSLLARGIGGFRELVGLVDPNTKSFNLEQNDLLTATLTESLGDNIDDRDAIIGTLTTANKQLNDYMENNKNADGSYTNVALATYQLRMTQTFIAYQTAKFFGDSRVSNADFKNAFDAMFGTFETDPEKQRKAFAIGLMRLHFLVGKQVEDDALQTRFARSLDPKNPKVMYDISANSGAKQYIELLRKTSQALVSNDQPDQYFGRVFPPEVYNNPNSRPFVQPVAPEVKLTVEDLGANKDGTTTSTTEVDAKPKRN